LRDEEKLAAFIEGWWKSNVPPEKPSLDWLSIRYDIFDQPEDEKN
jgi:hypothetical protein